MPIYSQMTDVQLRKRLIDLDAELEAREPEIMAEKRLIGRILSARGEEDRGRTYTSAKTPWDAINLCLSLSGNFVLTKKEMVDAIVSGGYLGPRPKAARALINDSVSYHLREGNLVFKGDKVGLPKHEK
jgi:hypothetical protein